MQLHRFFKALADPNRLRILNLLLDQPLCVCEMEVLLRLPQPLLSRHLAYLRSAGWVEDRRQGMRVQYSLASGHQLVEIVKHCLRSALLCEAIYREDRRRLEEMRTACCASEKRGLSVSDQTISVPREIRNENQSAAL